MRCRTVGKFANATWSILPDAIWSFQLRDAAQSSTTDHTTVRIDDARVATVKPFDAARVGNVNTVKFGAARVLVNGAGLNHDEQVWACWSRANGGCTLKKMRITNKGLSWIPEQEQRPNIRVRIRSSSRVSLQRSDHPVHTPRCRHQRSLLADVDRSQHDTDLAFEVEERHRCARSR